MITLDQITEKLRTVYDPEIPVNIFDLGLIYDIKPIGTEVYIIMTLTTATCPAAAFMPEEVKKAVWTIPGVSNVHVDVVYEPRWTQSRMSPEARVVLGFDS